MPEFRDAVIKALRAYRYQPSAQPSCLPVTMLFTLVLSRAIAQHRWEQQLRGLERPQRCQALINRVGRARRGAVQRR